MTVPVPGHEVSEAVAESHRREWALVLASAARAAGGDLDLAEAATQDAFVSALQTWPTRGIPRQPGAWLTWTARHRVTDLLRREARLRARLPALAQPEVRPEEETGVLDDRPRLVFTCCHPALSPEARVALTLRMVGGLTTAEIATAFLVSEPTMAGGEPARSHRQACAVTGCPGSPPTGLAADRARRHAPGGQLW